MGHISVSWRIVPPTWTVSTLSRESRMTSVRRGRQSAAESPALSVALAYHRAWTGKNLDDALSHVADDIVCDAPNGQLRGLNQYRPVLANFTPIVRGYNMIAALGDAETAVLVYDLHTIPVSSGLTCECFTVKDGRIRRNRLIFDQTPYTAARQQARQSELGELKTAA